jgi:hypothetical protein
MCSLLHYVLNVIPFCLSSSLYFCFKFVSTKKCSIGACWCPLLMFCCCLLIFLFYVMLMLVRSPFLCFVGVH